MIRVESPNNEHFKRWKTLSTPKGIRKEGEFILMGNKLVAEFMRDPGDWVIRAELVTDQLDPYLEKAYGDLRRDQPRGPKTYSLAPGLFNEIDVLGTHANLLVLEAPQIPAMDLSTKPKGLELVCPLGAPTNLGAVIRSALAFGVSRVILTEEACNPFHPKAVKSSAGADRRERG
jgi:TrmH family RNA methyltransferase